MVTRGTFLDYVMAMERVERRLRQIAAALDAAGVRYAVIGGNAVAAWVATVDPGATRTTKDIDLLVDQSDLGRITEVMERLALTRVDLRRLVLFVDPEEPSRKFGVHLVWAGRKVRPSYAHAAPTLDEAVLNDGGFLVLGLEALVRMKLTSNRDLDRVHVADLKAAGLIDEAVRESLPSDLRDVLDSIEAHDELEE